VTCMSDLGRWSPCSRQCQLAGPPFGLLSLESYLTSRQSPAPPFASAYCSSTVHDAAFCVYLGVGVLRSVWRFPTGTQVRGSTVKNDHLAIMGNMMLPWAYPTQNSFYGRIASNGFSFNGAANGLAWHTGVCACQHSRCSSTAGNLPLHPHWA